MANIDRAYSWAIATCNAPAVGYSQRYRNQQTVNGITWYDCSSFINYALLAGGFETPSYAPSNNPITTFNMISELLRLGYTEVDATGTYLEGDIGWESSHTEMCYRGGEGKGIFMGAHTDNALLVNQVSIGSSSGNAEYERSWTRLFRFGEGGAVGYGYSKYVVAALCGNAWRESNINPGLSEVGGGGFGLFQWTGGRRTALEAWLTDNGYELTDPYGQLNFLLVEDDWSGEFGGITSLTEFFESDSTDIAMLTEAFMTCWERPGIPALDERITHAQQCFDFITANAQNTSINAWVIKDGYLTESEILNNAVMLYRFMSAGGGAGGTKRNPTVKLPVWRKIRYF